MKLNILDTHDRHKSFTNQNFNISECIQDIIDKRPFGDHSFYIFSHGRTIGLDEKVQLIRDRHYDSLDKIPEIRMIWQPRLTKPKSQTNSMLFKVYPGTDHVKVIWIIPRREMWEQFEKGKVTANETIMQSIDMFVNHREKLDEKEEDDLPDYIIDQIYSEISRSANKEPFQMI